MTIDAWLEMAIADAERRGLPELKPMLETLARATRALREARFDTARDELYESISVDHSDESH